MKLTQRILFTLVILFALFIFYFSTKTISLTQNEFENEFKKSKILHTMYAYKLLYKKGSNIFLSKKEMTIFFHKWRKKILYTDFNKLRIKTQEEILKMLEKN